MFFSWRRRKPGSSKLNRRSPDMELVIPNHFRCPISLDLMKDPVTLSSGITYDRESIERWLEAGNFTCPVTNQVLRNFDQIPNHTLTRMIQDWCVENQNYGVERIPTPRVPVTSMEVSETLYCVETSAKRLDQFGCFELVEKIKNWGSESDRNKRCIVANGAAGVLASAFAAFSADNSFARNGNLLEEILSLFRWMFPLDEEAQMYLGSPASLRCIVWFLKCEDLSSKQNSMILLKALLSYHKKHAEALSSLEGVNEILFNFVKNPICQSITKASLLVIFHLVSSSSSSNAIKSEFVKMGLISTLIEIIIDSDKGLSEKALGVFDKLCDCKQGRGEAYENDLTMPLLVKKILRVSELATEYSVSSIWKLCKFDSEHEGRNLVEALQVGCFQKLLLLLQVGCGDETKEKATELMKLLNPYRAGLECIETSDFKNLKRSF